MLEFCEHCAHFEEQSCRGGPRLGQDGLTEIRSLAPQSELTDLLKKEGDAYSVDSAEKQ